MIHNSLPGKPLQTLPLLTYNIHCALLTGSPSLPSPWRLLTEAGVLLGSGVFFLPFTEKGEIPSMGIEQKKKEKVNA